MLGYGYYTSEIEPLSQPAVKVNDRVFNMEHYIKVLRFFGVGLNSAQDQIIAEQAVGTIQDSELITQAALKLQIGVTVLLLISNF